MTNNQKVDQKITDKSFNFHHKNDKTCLYTWHPSDNTVSWEAGEEEDAGDCPYATEYVDCYVKEGTWIVIPEPLQSFKVPAFVDSLGEYNVDVCDFNGKMAICLEEGPVFITKEQAMEFFGLREMS